MSIYTVNGSPVKCGNKWLTNGGTPSSELPPYDSTDAGKALVVNDDGDGVEWQDVGSSGVVDQHYDPTSSNAQSGTAVAEALQTVPDELPPITGNAGKVLKVNSGETGVEWATESGGASYTPGNGIDIVGDEISVDTSVVATQSDLSGKQDTLTPGNNITIQNNVISATDTTYTAGDGIDITENEVSVKVGTGLEIGNATKGFEGSQTIQSLGSEGSYSYYMYYLQLNAELVDAIENGGLTVTLDPNFECASSVFPVIVSSSYTLFNSGIFFGATSAAVSPGSVLNISLADRNETYSELDFNTVKSNPTNYYLGFGDANQYAKYLLQGRTPSTVTSITTEYSYSTTVANAVNVSNPLPASTSADVNKVLKVNASGNPEWVAEIDGHELFYVTYNVTTYAEIKAAHDAGKWPVLVDSYGRVAPMTDYGWIGSSSSIQYVKFQVSEYLFDGEPATGADYYNTVYWLELEIDPDLHRTETWSKTSHYSSADWNATSGIRAIRNKPTEKTLAAGSNVTITEANNAVTISATDTTYTAGKGVVIDNVNKTIRLDETVLWEGNGTTGTVMSLTETVKNFDRIRFYGHDSNRGRGGIYEINPKITYNSDTLQFAVSMTDAAYAGSTWFVGMYVTYLTYSDTNATSITVTGGDQAFSFVNSTTMSHNTSRYMIIDKIVGVNRIASA